MSTISNTTKNKTVTGSSSADSINNRAKNVTINAGKGNDTVTSYGASVSIEGGAGNDSLRSTGGAKVTLHGGKGNDTLTGSTSTDIFQFRYNGGSDVITNFGANDTLHIASGSLNTCYADGDDLIVKAKSGSTTGTMRLKNIAANSIKLKVGTGKVQTIKVINKISNSKANKLVSGSGACDSIKNTGASVTINGGNGDDTITTKGNSVSVFGGAGNDSIRSTGGTKVTLHGGAGNDTLTGSSKAEVFQFRADGGDDVITNFGANDTLHIASGSLNTYYVDGDDFIIEAKNSKKSGTVRLKNAAHDQIKVKVGTGKLQTIDVVNVIYDSGSNGTKGRDYISVEGGRMTIDSDDGNDTIIAWAPWSSISAGNGNDYIENLFTSYTEEDYVTTLDGGAGNDTIINRDYYTVINDESGNNSIYSAHYESTINTGSGNDTITSSAAIVNAGDGNNVVNGGSSITTGKGNDTINISYDATVRSGAGNDHIEAKNSHLVFNNSMIYAESGNDYIEIYWGGTLNGGKGNDTLITYSYHKNVFQYAPGDGNDRIINYYISTKQYNTSTTIHLLSGTIDNVISDGNDVTLKIGSGSIALEKAHAQPIQIMDSNGNLSTIYGHNAGEEFNNTLDNVSITGSDGDDTITSSGSNVTIDGGKGHDTIDSYGNDAVIYGNNGVNRVNSYGDNALIYGGTGRLNLHVTGNASTVVGSQGRNGILAEASNSRIDCGNSGDDILLETARNTTINTADGNDTLWGDESSNIILNGGAGDDYIDTFDTNHATLIGGAGNDTLNWSGMYNYYFSLDGGDGDDIIYGDNIPQSTIRGGKGNDTITYAGGTSFLSLEGSTHLVTMEGTGSILLYANGDGNDIIQIPSDEDGTIFISLTSGTLDQVVKSKLDRVLKIGSGSMTIEEGRRNTISVTDSEGNNTVINPDNAVKIIYSSESNVTLKGGNDIDKIVSERSSNVLIRSLNGNDTVEGSGNHITIDGGKGNDSIESRGSYNSILGGAGNDEIVNSASLTAVDAGNGNDSIINSYYSRYVTIDGGAGNDSIMNWGLEAEIYAGTGNDYIQRTRRSATIDGGRGNDTIAFEDDSTLNVGSCLYQYANGDGDDVIVNYFANDIIQLTSGSISNSSISGNDVILRIGKGSITLKNAKETPVQVINADGTSATLNSGSSAQLPIDEYWFEQDDPIAESPLDQILAPDTPIDLNFDDVSETFKPKLELVSSARKQSKK